MSRMRQDAPKTLLWGQAGVWRVASELALRGFHPHFPGVDYGYDLALDAGVRLQVKSTHLSMRGSYGQNGGAYWFHLRRGAVAHGNNRIMRASPRIFSERCDFVVLFGIEQGRFWIVPASELDGVSLVAVGHSESWYRNVDVEQIRQLRDEGNSIERIAAIVGVSDKTVSRRLKGEYLESGKMADRVRGCENRWDLIDSFLRTLQGVEKETIVFPAEVAGELRSV